jgi:hypothetical protein
VNMPHPNPMVVRRFESIVTLQGINLVTRHT